MFVDENDNVLDGHHRLKIDPDAPRKVIRGLSPGEKEAFVFRTNHARRNLSGDQKRELHAKMKLTAAKLRAEDAKKWTQAKVAEALGVAQQTVSDWFPTVRSNTGAGKASKPKPDARTKVTPEGKQKAYERVVAGETQEQVAADDAKPACPQLSLLDAHLTETRGRFGQRTSERLSLKKTRPPADAVRQRSTIRPVARHRLHRRAARSGFTHASGGHRSGPHPRPNGP